MEIVVATRTLELWLLEDMSLAVVSCVSVNYDHDGYITQYRTIKDMRSWTASCAWTWASLWRT